MFDVSDDIGGCGDTDAGAGVVRTGMDADVSFVCMSVGADGSEFVDECPDAAGADVDSGAVATLDALVARPPEAS